MQKGNNNNNH